MGPDRNYFVEGIAQMLSDMAKLVMVLGVIPLVFMLAGPVFTAVMP